jgi:adenosylmethionine---8-amino-7-oxononanoate aminotransferase
MEDALLLKKDQDSIWHPYTQALTCQRPLLIRRAKGALLYTSQGVAIIDAISSWWTTLHGHAHPYIIEKMSQQLQELQHVMFAEITHAPAILLADKLLSLLPKNYRRLSFSDNGSTAVETALKMAFQYWFNQDPATKRKRVIAFRHGYHGDTFGAMSISGRGLFTQPFQHAFFATDFIDPPQIGSEEQTLEQLRSCLEKEESACFIFEPLIQGVGGMRCHTLQGLEACIKLCHEFGVITIADEVMTGFGRTGPHFVIEQLKERPQILCLSKGLTGGVMPLAVTVCEEKIYERFLSEERSKAFLHGHSFSGNPLACSAALASLELLEKRECAEKRAAIAKAHREFAAQKQGDPRLHRVETIGTILVIEYKIDGVTSYYNHLREKLLAHFRKEAILMRPFGNLIHVMPPYCITHSQLEQIYHAIERSL